MNGANFFCKNDIELKDDIKTIYVMNIIYKLVRRESHRTIYGT